MPPIVTFWILLGLVLPAGLVRGQETDPLFFRPDSLPLPAGQMKAARQPGVGQQRQSAEPFMQTRIHFTGDFFRQFNALAGDDTQRKQRLRQLFDGEDPRFAPTSQMSAYARLIDEFADDVCQGPTVRTLTNPNEQLYAEVLGRVAVQQQAHALKLYLKKHQTGPDWAWEIVGAETDFRLPAADSTVLPTGSRSVSGRNSPAFIPPNAHELNFMGLTKQLRAGLPLGLFASAESGRDTTLMALAQGLATGQLRLQALLTTTLWLNTQWGWWLQLRQFDRDSDNAGWLISDLCRAGGVPCLPVPLRRFSLR